MASPNPTSSMGEPLPWVIVNPLSGAGQLGREWAHLKHQLFQAIGPFEEKMTERPGQATELTRNALSCGAQLVIAVGGDGTLNEVVNGFWQDGVHVNPESQLGILMRGTGSDFVKSLWPANNLEGAIENLKGEDTFPIDVGRCTLETADGSKSTRYFLNVASWGLSGVVARKVNTGYYRRLGGRWAYLLPSLFAGLGYTNQKVVLGLDGEEEECVLNTLAICNGQYFGGGMWIAPEADVTDGLFDVIRVGDVNAIELALQLPRLYRGMHLSHGKVQHHKARSISIKPLEIKTPLALNIDGEVLDAVDVTFDILPNALKIRGLKSAHSL